MAIVPMLDLRESAVAPSFAQPPANIEAEQALLGAVLYDNGALDRLRDPLQDSHFFEPLHGRLFAAVRDLTNGGRLADPIVLGEMFRADAAFEQLGGIRYLADMIDRAPPAAHADAYGHVIFDLALKRELIRIGGEMAQSAEAGGAGAPAIEQIETVEQQLFDLAEKGVRESGFQSFSTSLRGAVELAGEAYRRDGGLAGLSTGLVDLDRTLGGLHRSDLVIIAARPGMGKSALATNIAFHAARHWAWEPGPDGKKRTVDGGVVALFSLEMSAEQLAMRLLAEVTGISSDRIRKGEITPAEYGEIADAAAEIGEAPLYIDATGGLPIGKLAARARRLQRTVGLDLLIVDYLQLVTTGSNRADNRVQEVSLVTQSLKALAKDLNVPVVALSQLSRQTELRDDKRPQLADLRESGSIEQDADVVMFIYREAYYLKHRAPKEGTEEHLKWQDELDGLRNLAEIIIAKQRHGPTDTVKVHFDENLTKFSNRASEHRYEVH